jgi:hypothetical protein
VTQQHLKLCSKLTSQLDHLQARCMQKQATTVGLYWRHMVVRCRLQHKIIHSPYHHYTHTTNTDHCKCQRRWTVGSTYCPFINPIRMAYCHFLFYRTMDNRGKALTEPVTIILISDCGIQRASQGKTISK